MLFQSLIQYGEALRTHRKLFLRETTAAPSAKISRTNGTRNSTFVAATWDGRMLNSYALVREAALGVDPLDERVVARVYPDGLPDLEKLRYTHSNSRLELGSLG